jgi:hypothetical protein
MTIWKMMREHTWKINRERYLMNSVSQGRTGSEKKKKEKTDKHHKS